MSSLRIRRRDASARIAELSTKSGKLLLPNFFPVFNPNKPVVTPEEMKRIGVEAIITNSYIIYKNEKMREEALKRGIHSAIGFDGIIMTDSGAYQLYRYGGIEISNREIIRFQHAIGSDIGTILDVPMSSDISRKEAEKGVKTTIDHAIEWKSISEELKGTLWLGTPQGGPYDDLIYESAKRIAELGFDYYGVGSIKVALEEYNFTMQADLLMKVRGFLQPNKPVHFWGIGLPSSFSLFVALGADTFDSASYALYAAEGRYMTPERTIPLDELEEFPCSCPICSKYSVKEVKEMEKGERERIISIHNLYVSIQEMRKIRTAIREGWLWNLVQERARAHPKLLKALLHTLWKYRDELEEREPVTKRSAVFYSGPETLIRPEVLRARKIVRRIEAERYFRTSIYGNVPLGLKYTFPFGQTVSMDEEVEDEPSDEEMIYNIISYQFGVEAAKVFKNLRVRRSRRTGMPRDVYSDDVRIGFIRPQDCFFIPSLKGAELLVKMLPWPACRVVVKREYEDEVAKGTTVFSDFVEELDPKIRPNSEVIVVNKQDKVLATGKAVLSASEVRYFKGHPFVIIRHHLMHRD
ncbi:MAG: tRNA guanosine(15) transglycosylase TgtA [Candidatus Methanodesulfokora sp.]